ncbi:MAG: HAMP domain-containing protein [Acidobacteria bacterium]|nr:HAMP domain-containing protein [Acidobacteriota bacterium]MBI3423138.1 HAMP domain-containing protein [Acidobacteriota bacterium]
MKRESSIGNLKLWQKQALIVTLLSLSVVALLSLTIREKNGGIEFARNEVNGVVYLRTLRTLLDHSAQFIGAGNNSKAERIDDTLLQLENLDRQWGAELKTSDQLRALTAQWQGMKSKGAAAALNAAFLASIRALMMQVTDTSGLFVDPDLDAVYTMETVALELPRQQDFIAQAMWLGTRALTNKQLPLADRVKLLGLSAEIQTVTETAKSNVEKAVGYNTSGVVKALEPKLQENLAAVQTLLEWLNQKILAPASLETSTNNEAQEFVTVSNTALNTSFNCWDGATQTLADLIGARSASLAWNRNAFLLGGVLMALVVGMTLFMLARKVGRQLKTLTKLVDEINAGNTEARAEVLAKDELGLLAQAFNEMLDANQGLVQTRGERDEIQRSIMKLLDEVSGVARGDLSREAEVTDGMTGAIADAFNYMIEQLRHIIGKVQTVAREVNVTASATQRNTQHLAEEAKQRAEQLVSAAHEIDAMAFSIRNVAETAEASKLVAQKTLETAKRGSKILQGTIKGVSQVRDQVLESSQHLKQLSATSREIGEVVQVIEEIAKRTSVLALHASIQAASAGEAGRGFAVVVREVEHLALRSTEAAKLIGELVNRTRQNAQTAASAMEESSRGVHEGTTMICEAGDALVEIEQVMAQLTDLIQSISRTTEVQTKESAAVSSAMLQLSEATRQTATGISRSATTATQLAALADDLNGSVASFKLAAHERSTGRLGRLTGSSLRPISVEEWGSGQYFTQN